MTKWIMFLVSVLTAMLMLTGCNGCGSKKESVEEKTTDGKHAAPAVKEKAVVLPDAPDALVKELFAQIDARNPAIVWEAMPEGYQNDINGLVQNFAKKMDPELWDKGFALLQKATDVAKTKKDFLLNTPMIAQQIDAKKKEEMVKGWDGGMAVFHYLATSKLAKLENLKTFDGGVFISSMNESAKQMDAKDLKAIETLMKAYAVEGANNTEKLTDIKVALVNNDGKTAKLSLTSPDGTKEDVELVKVEGKWVPKQLADEWTKILTEIKTGITGISKEELTKNKPQMLAVIAAFESGVTQLSNAKTQKEFDTVLMGLLQGMQ